MQKSLEIRHKPLIFKKNILLTFLLILFSIGSYTYSESTKHPLKTKIDRLKQNSTIKEIQLRIPLYYESPEAKIKQPVKTKLVIHVPSEKVMDNGVFNAYQLAGFLLKNNNRIDTSYALTLANHYISEAEHEGVNPELAFTQMCHETGFLRFGGTVNPKQNNFCGLGVTGNGVVGLSFRTAKEGVRAHIQHLKAYGSTDNLNNKLVDSRFNLVKRGSGRNLSDLTGKWATDRLYDKKIRILLNRLFRLSNNTPGIES